MTSRFNIGVEEDSSDFQALEGKTSVLLSGNPLTVWNPSSPTTFFCSTLFRVGLAKTKSFAETFFKYQPRNWWQSFVFDFYAFASHWLSAEPTQKGEVTGRGEGTQGKGNGRFLSSMFKCLFHSTRRSSSSAHTQPHQGTGSTLLMMAERIIDYAHHRRKPFCLALIPSGSFTFWRIEKNELKIKIISLIWLHLRFMAAAFKGNREKKPNCRIHICTISCLSIFYKCYEQSQPLGTLKLKNLYPSPILVWEHYQ